MSKERTPSCFSMLKALLSLKQPRSNVTASAQQQVGYLNSHSVLKDNNGLATSQATDYQTCKPLPTAEIPAQNMSLSFSGCTKEENETLPVYESPYYTRHGFSLYKPDVLETIKECVDGFSAELRELSMKVHGRSFISLPPPT